MASYHLAVKAISRAAGRSATAAAAYRAGVEITDERTGLVHDYTRKQGIVHRELVVPDGAPAWSADRSALWNAAEAAERRKDAKVAREYEIALPSELSADERRDLAVGFARHITARYGVAVDVAIHEPGREGDQRNHHAHLLTTTRRLDAEGLGDKTRTLDVKATATVEVEQLREQWAAMQNRALERAQREERVDHRSFQRQGHQQEATVHMGPQVSAMERRAEKSATREGRTYEPVTKVGQHNAAVTEKRGLRRYIEKGERYILRAEAWLVRNAGPTLGKVATAIGRAIAGDREKAEQARKAQELLQQQQQREIEKQRQRIQRLMRGGGLER